MANIDGDDTGLPDLVSADANKVVVVNSSGDDFSLITQSSLISNGITIDTTLQNGSGNAISNNAVFDALELKQDSLTFNAPSSDNSNPSTSAQIKSALDGKQDSLTLGTQAGNVLQVHSSNNLAAQDFIRRRNANNGQVEGISLASISALTRTFTNASINGDDNPLSNLPVSALKYDANIDIKDVNLVSTAGSLNMKSEGSYELQMDGITNRNNQNSNIGFRLQYRREHL